MAGYSSARKLTNVVGRVDYISNPERQEKIMSFHNTTDNEFWYKLAQESQEQFKQSGTHGKCCEAREFIIGLPQNCVPNCRYKGKICQLQGIIPY